MDHRCLYGHRVPAAFTFAIQSRSCPTCGAPTITINGYQAARKLASEAGLDAVGAFNAVRVLEADWVLTPLGTVPAAVPATGPALAAEAAPVTEEEVVVEDEIPEPAVVAPPEPRITARPRPEKRPPEPRVEPAPAPPPAAARAAGFGDEEEDFFKQA
jgi:hypothetical protein